MTRKLMIQGIPGPGVSQCFVDTVGYISVTPKLQCARHVYTRSI